MFTIWLIGATNAGKSTLFNRLIWQFRAIVTDIHWTTRDVLYHETQLEDIGQVRFADSPWLLDFTEELWYIKRIVDQSDLLLFLVDDTAWITAKEHHIAEYIREKHKQNATILVVNKLDLKRKVTQMELAVADYYSFWFSTVLGVSAKKEIHLELLQDAITTYYKKWKKLTKPVKEVKKPQAKTFSLAIVGKPNAGKSTLLNTFVKKTLSKVHEEAWTTRDYVVWEFIYNNQTYTVYDTAGIRKKWQTHGIEKIAYDKTLDMLKYVRPVVIFLVDAITGLSHRDMTLIEEMYRIGLPIVIWLNKTDLLNKQQQKRAVLVLQSMLRFATYIPILPISATTWAWLPELLKMAHAIYEEAFKRVGTNELNKVFHQEIIKRPPRFPKNKVCKILYVTQADVNAPTFIVFVNNAARANFSFRWWIENTLRGHFWFVGVPLVIKFKNREDRTDEDEWWDEKPRKRKVVEKR